MIYHKEITIQPKVSAIAPDEYIIPMGNGTLTKVQISPPPGPNWEVYCRVLHFEDPIIPNNNDEWIPLERETLTFTPNFNNWNEIYTLKLQICSPQARYSHTIQFLFELQETLGTDELLNEFIKKGM